MKKITSKFPHLKILIVDDDLICREVSKEILELMDCKVDSAVDGKEGIEMAKNKDYDLILMDIQMPQLDGFEATRRIREFGKPGLMLMALTASAAMTMQDCKLKGMDDFIIKPVDASGFEEKLLKYFTAE